MLGRFGDGSRPGGDGEKAAPSACPRSALWRVPTQIYLVLSQRLLYSQYQDTSFQFNTVSVEKITAGLQTHLGKSIKQKVGRSIGTPQISCKSSMPDPPRDSVLKRSPAAANGTPPLGKGTPLVEVAMGLLLPSIGTPFAVIRDSFCRAM